MNTVKIQLNHPGFNIETMQTRNHISPNFTSLSDNLVYVKYRPVPL